MKKIKSANELASYLWPDDSAYDIDSRFKIMDADGNIEMAYEYPIWIDFRGGTGLGAAYKIYSKQELLELKKVLNEIEE